MKIAQVTNLFESVPPENQHGLERVVYDLTEELVKMGHEVTLFATADSQTSAKLVAMWPKAVGKDEYGKILDGSTYSMWSVSEAFIRQKEFDVIHDHTRFVAAHFAGAINTPVVTTIHHPVSKELDFPLQYPVEYQAYFKKITTRNLSHINPVVVSDFQAQIFNRGYGRMPTVIYNGLPLELWPFCQTPQDYFAFLGYITPDKGAAEAIQAILPTGQKLKIAGPLDDREINQNYFLQRIKPYLNNNIEYVGSLGFDQKSLLQN